MHLCGNTHVFVHIPAGLGFPISFSILSFETGGQELPEILPVYTPVLGSQVNYYTCFCVCCVCVGGGGNWGSKFKVSCFNNWASTGFVFLGFFLFCFIVCLILGLTM